LYTKTTKLAQKASEEIDDAYDELSSRLSANINDAINTARNNIRIDVYSYIEQNVDNDELKAELERLSKLYIKRAALQVKENGMESLEDYLNNLKNALERFSRFMEEFSKKIFEDELKMEAAQLIRENEAFIKETSNAKAREIVSTVLQRCAIDQVVESTVSVVADTMSIIRAWILISNCSLEVLFTCGDLSTV
jgi:ribonuclease Y